MWVGSVATACNRQPRRMQASVVLSRSLRALVESSKPYWRLLGVTVVESRQLGVGRLDPALLSHEPCADGPRSRLPVGVQSE